MKNKGNFNEYFFRKQFERLYLGTFNIWGMFYNNHSGVTLVGDSEPCNSVHLNCHAQFDDNEWSIIWELTDGQKHGLRKILDDNDCSKYLTKQEN